MKKTWCSILAAIALAICFSGSALSQETTGSIVGTVKDSSGGAVAGATVTVSDATKNVTVRTATTNADGEFTLPNLLVSVYNLTIEAPNFKKSLQKDVKIDVGQRRSLDVV